MSIIKKIGYLVLALAILSSVSACTVKRNDTSAGYSPAVTESPAVSILPEDAAEMSTPEPASTPAPAEPSAAPLTWQEAYKEYLTVDLYNADNPYLWFAFADINGDLVPELYTLENTNDIMIQIQDNNAPGYEQGAVINMYSFDGFGVIQAASLGFGNSPGDFRFDYANNYIWHYSIYMSQGNIEEITAYSFENGSLELKFYAVADSTVFAYSGGENEDDILYEPDKQEFESAYGALSSYEGINWWFIEDDVSYAISSYEDWISYISQPGAEAY